MNETNIHLTAVTLGLVQVFKQMGLPKQYCPLVAVVTGIVAYALSFGFSPMGVLVGTVVGLSSMGLYDGGSYLGNAAKDVAGKFGGPYDRSM